MLKMHADDKQRFRAIGLSGVLLFVRHKWCVVVFVSVLVFAAACTSKLK